MIEVYSPDTHHHYNLKYHDSCFIYSCYFVCMGYTIEHGNDETDQGQVWR